MKKTLKLIAVLVLLVLGFYFVIILNGLSIITGFGTPYSYFEAQKATKNDILILYEQELTHPTSTYNYDSLELSYGFKWEYGGSKVSYPVIRLYNSVIENELHRRLGSRWSEYQSKIDSISKKNSNRKEFRFPPR
jgi:hypothetical protein